MSSNILFVCVENARRSQMAEAFFKKYAPKKFNVFSAGTNPSSQLNSLLFPIIASIGIIVALQITIIARRR